MAYFGELYDEDDVRFKKPSFKDKCIRYKNWIIAGIVIVILVIIIIISIVCTVGRSDDVLVDSNGILIKTGRFRRPDFSANQATVKEFETFESAKNAVPLSSNFEYGKSHVIRGVNLGGWLVLEPSITPSLFTKHIQTEKTLDEFTLCKKLGRTKCGDVLNEHYKTFITEGDIAKLREEGINHVRIPIGYWAASIHSDEPFVYGSFEYLLKGIRWCAKYGIRVMIDFHAVPGSQNGYFSSGQSGTRRLRNNGLTRKDREVASRRYNEAFELITRYFFNHDSHWGNVVTMFNLVDNPTFNTNHSEYNGLMLYQEKIHQLRGLNARVNHPIVSIHDYSNDFHWSGIFNTNLYQGVVFDYRNPILHQNSFVSANEAPDKVCDLLKLRRESSNSLDPKLLNGALSLAFNECGTNIDYIKTSSSFNGSCDDFTKLDNIKMSLVKNYARKLISSYEQDGNYGWFFWTLKTEGKVNPLMSYRVAHDQGWLPDLNSPLPNQCP